MQKNYLFSILNKLIVALVLLLVPCAVSAAFTGSDPEAGKSYYLFNIYQAKFLGAGNKLQAPNIGTPVAFSYGASGFSIGGTTYAASKNAAGYYQLKNGSNFFAFEDKVADADSPEDENRALYLGGGVTCQNTTNDTDRSYWQIISADEYAEWTAKKKFTVASLNVDGMPKSVKVAGVYTVNLNPDATEGPGATAIGTRLKDSGFDVVGVSEDFNYHSELWNAAWNNGGGVHYNATTHRGSISAGLGAVGDYLGKKPVLDSDGLGLFYRINGSSNIVTPSNESWTQWNDHYGYDDSGADGLIKKGFRYYLITLADGTEIDLYTMHMDAESSAGDNAARESQMRQLVTAIKATNNKRPIVIIGDSNCRYTRDKVKELLIDALNADERFTCRDPWIQYGRGNSYPAYNSASIMASVNGYLQGEVVDKIWYVNNKDCDIRIVAETYAQDLSFVAPSDVAGTSLKLGSPLCDHKPCVVTFSYHTYNPLVDDVAVVETSEEAVFLRNRANGRYLADGGWWSTHAVVCNYARMPMYLKSLPDGKYDLSTKFGHITDAAYVDNNNAEEYISGWTVLEEDGYKIFAYEQGGVMKALSSNDPTYFNNDPLYRYVTTAPLDVTDKNQQWEIVTKQMLEDEIRQANYLHPVNVTHLLPAANFDRNDWDDHGKWTLTKAGNQVSDQNVGGADNDGFCNFNRGIKTKKSGTTNRNTWDLYQSITVPAGYYYITCQGFCTTNQTYFYAWSNPEGSQVTKQVDIAGHTSVAEADRPNATSTSQTEAMNAFNKGLYQNALPVVKVGSDGKLVVGVKKTQNNSSDTWACIDNFQLLYLGTEEPQALQESYLYNVESGMFLNQGYDYNARAVLADEGKVWVPTYRSSGIAYNRKDEGGHLGIAKDGLLGTFVDWRDADTWNITMDANGAMTLESNNFRGQYIGWTSESHGDFVSDGSVNTNRELNDAIYWKAVLVSEYASFKTTAAANKAARLAAVDIYRSAHISGIDVTEFANAWHNPNTSATDITEKAQALKTALEAHAAENASTTNPYNVSYYIVNATCGDEAQTGWTKVGDWGSQIGENPAYKHDGVALAPRFYEKYDGTKLADAKISQVISGLPVGRYALALDINAEKQSDNNASITGTLLYAKVGSKERVTANCDTHGAGVLPATVQTVMFGVGAGDDVEIGLSLEDTNANWVAFDNWQLLYLGKPLLGDVNSDEKVSIVDITALVKYLLTNETPAYFDAINADADESGTIDVDDLGAIINILMK